MATAPSAADLTPYTGVTWVDVPLGATPPPDAVAEDATAFNRIERALETVSRVAIAAWQLASTTPGTPAPGSNYDGGTVA